MEKTKYFVVQDQQGKFLAINNGYPWYPEDVRCAQLFKVVANSMEYIQSCEKEGENFVVREVFLGDPTPFENMLEGAAAIDIRREALAKLSRLERQVLGL